MKRKRKILTYFLICCLAVTAIGGCGTKQNVLFENYHVNGSFADDSSVSDIDYISKDVCVIPKKKQSDPKDISMTALASMIINESKKEMVYSNNIYKKIYPASITKIVTAYVVLDKISSGENSLDEIVTISYNASHITESGAVLCGFAKGDKISLRDLLYSFLICSGNDAGIALAEHIGGDVDTFAAMMNEEMKELGAVHSHFVNPHGLHDDDHYTTAYDLYLIFRQLIKNDTFLDIIHHGYFVAKFNGANGSAKKLSFTSTDRYLTGRAFAPAGVEVIGGKTGTTFKAGSCLILYSQNSKKEKFISVVLKAAGPDDLYRQMSHLMSME